MPEAPDLTRAKVGTVLGLADKLLRQQYLVMIAWAALLLCLSGACWYSVYKLGMIFTEYTRALSDLKRMMVRSDDLFNTAMDDEELGGETAEEAEKKRVPSGQDVLRRLRKYERQGGGRSDLAGALDSSKDSWEKPAASEETDEF